MKKEYDLIFLIFWKLLLATSRVNLKDKTWTVEEFRNYFLAGDSFYSSDQLKEALELFYNFGIIDLNGNLKEKDNKEQYSINVNLLNRHA